MWGCARARNEHCGYRPGPDGIGSGSWGAAVGVVVPTARGDLVFAPAVAAVHYQMYENLAADPSPVDLRQLEQGLKGTAVAAGGASIVLGTAGVFSPHAWVARAAIWLGSTSAATGIGGATVEGYRTGEYSALQKELMFGAMLNRGKVFAQGDEVLESLHSVAENFNWLDGALDFNEGRRACSIPMKCE